MPAPIASPIERRAYRPEELAEAWGCSRAHIYKLLDSGALKSLKIGRSRRILVSAVEEFENGGGVDVVAS